MKSARVVADDFQRTQRASELANDEAAEYQARERSKKNLDFVQFQRKGMKEFIGLISRSPAAAQALIVMATFMNRTNAVSISMSTLCQACGASRATLSRAVKVLAQEKWILLAKSGTTRTYHVNANIFWSASRDLKNVKDVFAATIITKATNPRSPIALNSKNVPIVTSKHNELAK